MRRAPRARLLAGLLTASLLTGCAEVEVSTELRPHTVNGHDPDSTWHLHANVWGYYLLAKIPLITGSVDEPGRLAWFTDTVNQPGVTRLLGDAASALGVDELRDVQSMVTSNWLLLVLWLPECWATATVTRPPALKEIPPLEPADGPQVGGGS